MLRSLKMRHAHSVSRVILAVFLTVSAGACKQPAPPASDDSMAWADGAVVKLYKEPVAVADFQVTDLDGKTWTSAALKGKVVFINYWATWCPPCRAEIPDLVALQQKYKDQIVVVGISEDEIAPDQVKAFADKYAV